MPKQSYNPRSVRQHRSKLLCVAEGVLSQATRRADISLSWAELDTARQAAAELSEWPNGQPAPTTRLKLASGAQGQATASYMALFSLALRRSSPFVTGGGKPQMYASVRQHLCSGLQCAVVDDEVGWGHFCAEVLAPALLRTDTLECYSRLLAEAAEQLQPDAVAALPVTAANACTTAAVEGVEASHGMGSTTARKERQERCVAQAEPAGQADKPRPGPLTQQEVSNLNSELYEVLLIYQLGMDHLDQEQQQQQQSVPTASDPDSSQASSSAPSPQPANNLPHDICNQLQSSWVLEHWARVLLLGAAPALASGDRADQENAQALQVCMLHNLSYVPHLDWSAFLRRPWGCTLSAAHMAHLCAALDGGLAFGWPRPELVVLPGAGQDEQDFAAWRDSAADASESAAAAAGRAVSLLSALDILRAWMSVLESELPEGPRQAGVGADGGMQRVEREASGDAAEVPGARDGADMAAAVVVHQDGRAAGEAPGAAAEAPAAGGSAAPAVTAVARQGGLAAGEAGPLPAVQDACREADGAEAGAAGGGSFAALVPPADSPCSGLPPLSRSATVTLCLRLAKGVLARWGEEVGEVRLFRHGGGWGSHNPLLPKVSGCSLLHQPLACARLALLPDVWGRERVPRRTRAQLREWWETYVAAAQHPEALAVAAFSPFDPHFDWMEKCRGASRPSADASAALAAGLLPCMTRLVDRIGAARDDDTVWDSQAPFAGLGPCCAEVLLHGPLGQVGELVSAVGRRLRVVVEELRTAAAAGGHGGGRSVERAADGAVVSIGHATFLVYIIVREGLEAVPHPEANAALRFSWAAADLLPAVSALFLLCSEVCNGEGVAVGLGCGAAASEDSRARTRAAGARLCKLLWCSGRIHLLAVPLLAKHGRAGVADTEQASGGDGGRGCGGGKRSSTCGGGSGGRGDGGGSDGISSSNSTSSGGRSGGDVDGGGAAADPGTPWRQLLLRDVRLLELLGAVAELHSEQAVAAVAKYDEEMLDWLDEPRSKLAHVLALAAAAFPAEFRAAVGEGATRAGAGTGTGAGTGAGAGACEGLQMAVGGAGCAAGSGTKMSAEAGALAGVEPGVARKSRGAERGDGGSSTAKPCISLAAVHEALRSGAFGEQLGVVDRVLGGWEPTPGEVWDLVCSCCHDSCGLRREQLEALMPLMLPPAEARAAVGAATAAVPASSAVG